jgi:hypothetical protein
MVTMMTDPLDESMLTPEWFTQLLKQNWSGYTGVPSILKCRADPVEQGVLSRVYRVHLDYEESASAASKAATTTLDASSIPPNLWIVKFRRGELDLEWMFVTETAFYSKFRNSLLAAVDSSTNLPFEIPQMLYGSNDCIVLKGIPQATCHQLSEGCPHDKISVLLECLSAWHATCWESPLFQEELVSLLSNPPGIGHRLDKLQLEHLVRQDWSMFLNNITDMDPKLRQASQTLSETLAPLRLRNVQEQVQEQKWTCVHGDYHIANWLFPNNGDGKQKPVLVDWATCGHGNPMVDVAFFLVVSSDDEVVSNVHPWLHRYYETLLKWNPKIELTYDTCCEWFQLALLNQWIILVAYDGMCRVIAQAEPDASKRQGILNHFQRVNRRALLCMTSSFEWTEIIASLPVATEEERNQAKTYSDQTPLAI